MITIQWRPYDFKIVEDADKKRKIFDIIRGKYVILTPEEWVRQNVIRYLVEDLKYPKGLIAVEKKVVFYQISKRFDIVVFNSEHKPWMLIECKEPKVEIDNTTLSQGLVYHSQLQCEYVVLTNGRATFCAALNGVSLTWLHELPLFK